MKKNKLVSIISVNYNGLEDTCQMIESVLEHVAGRYEIIIVDNGSRRNEAELIKERFPEVFSLRSEKNLGFAGGNNLGILQARGDYLFFLNNDTFIEEDPLPVLISRLETSPAAGGVSPKIRFAWGGREIQFAGYTALSGVTLRNSLKGYMQADGDCYNKECLTPYIHGAAFMLKKEVVDKAGMMPELYFLYYEELDWSERIREQGYGLWYEPRAVVFHKESRSTGASSPLKAYYMTRNRLVYASRNRRGAQKWFSIIYQLGLAVPKQIGVNIFRGRTDLAAAALRGAGDFFKYFK